MSVCLCKQEGEEERTTTKPDPWKAGNARIAMVQAQSTQIVLCISNTRDFNKKEEKEYKQMLSSQTISQHKMLMLPDCESGPLNRLIVIVLQVHSLGRKHYLYTRTPLQRQLLNENQPCLQCFKQAITISFGSWQIKLSCVYNNLVEIRKYNLGTQFAELDH